jgi:hypothetical protein
MFILLPENMFRILKISLRSFGKAIRISHAALNSKRASRNL